MTPFITEQDSELQLLSNVHDALSINSEASQRDLAQYTNLSLGMTNALLRRFADKGWLYMKKISKRNIQYVLTPQGMKELAARSKRYLKNTARLMNEYQGCIRRFVQDSSRAGCTSLILVGDNDLEFLFDYACHFCKLSFIKIASEDFNPQHGYVTSNSLIVFSDEGRYESVQKNIGASADVKRYTSVIDILSSAEALPV
ncbi:hypothetical protein V1L52_06620 [Treponema sp. HNW]|uniref:hypothetical protein n=1 Tax=Treponema sp. HNW TaxID=3116654 RepID=UPI003D0AA251